MSGVFEGLACLLVCFSCGSEVRRMSSFKNKDEFCSICLENFGSHITTKLSCNHIYHKTCYEEWIRKGKILCPNCGM